MIMTKENNILTKEQFVKYIGKIQECYEFENEISEAFYKYGCQAPEFPFPYNEMVDVLNVMFTLETNDNWGSDIDYFCIELDFGKKYKPGCIKDENGNEIDLSSAEKLYDYITRGKSDGS